MRIRIVISCTYIFSRERSRDRFFFDVLISRMDHIPTPTLCTSKQLLVLLDEYLNTINKVNPCSPFSFRTLERATSDDVDIETVLNNVSLLTIFKTRKDMSFLIVTPFLFLC